MLIIRVTRILNFGASKPSIHLNKWKTFTESTATTWIRKVDTGQTQKDRKLPAILSYNMLTHINKIVNRSKSSILITSIVILNMNIDRIIVGNNKKLHVDNSTDLLLSSVSMRKLHYIQLNLNLKKWIMNGVIITNRKCKL